MSSFYSQKAPTSSAVISLNGLTGALTLVEGAGITITPLGSNITIASTVVGTTAKKELFVLTNTDITNQYVDLLHVAETDSVNLVVQGGYIQIEGSSYDYTLSYTGGAGGKTRLTFKNGLATGGVSALIAGDVIVVQYRY